MNIRKEEEELALQEFRNKVAPFLPEDLVNDDAFLMQWLIARDFNLEKATRMLQQYMEWRCANGIDRILDWDPPADLKSACPYEIFMDSTGRPVLLFPWARWTPWDFTDNGRRDEYVKYMYQMLEKCVAAIKKPATQFVIVADSEGFSLRHMSRISAIDANMELLRGFECRYPEMMSLAIALNCPKIFSVLFNLIKPLMSSRTLDKLEILDCNSNKWKKFLSNYISEDQLPVKYGGSRQG